MALAALFVAALFTLAACSAAATPSAVPTTQAPEAPAEPVKLRMANLPILDILPMLVAQQEGLFEKHGVTAEFIPAASAAERDQIFAACQADGMINDGVSTLFYNQDQTQIQVVRFARTATSTFPQYMILASAQSGIDSVDGLKGVEIGVSQGTVIEYITDRLLQAAGLAPDEIKTIAVPKIPDRMALLGSGELNAATLPDPLSTLAIQQGAKTIIDDTSHPEYGYSVYSFRKQMIDENPEAIRGFLAAIEEAIALINADPTKWDSLMVEQKLLPEPLAGAYKLPPFPTASVPSQAQWDDVLAWAKDEGLIKNDLSYQESVNPSLLP
jgi:NitT/TauT family transport system substrate-binding protein